MKLKVTGHDSFEVENPSVTIGKKIVSAARAAAAPHIAVQGHHTAKPPRKKAK